MRVSNGLKFGGTQFWWRRWGGGGSGGGDDGGGGDGANVMRRSRMEMLGRIAQKLCEQV